MERLRSIFEAERHTEEFEKSKWGDNGSLWNVIWVNGYLVIASDQVHLAEDDLTGQVGREIVYPRDRIPIVLRGAVQPSVVSAGTPASPRLRSNVER